MFIQKFIVLGTVRSLSVSFFIRDTTSAWEQTVNILFLRGQGRRRTKGRGRYQTQATQAE
jgi:hypothetical protein